MVGNSKHSVPKSALTGILWPAVPNRNDALLLAVVGQLEESQWWTPEALLFQQLRQIERILGHALSTVPYYKQRLGFLAGRKAGTLTLEDFRRIPVLRRADIQEAGAALISTKIPSDHSPVFDIKTSGSTGRPIVTKGTAITGLMLRAANLRYHLWFKRDFSAKTACIRMLKGKQLEAAKANRAVPWADGFSSGPMVMRHVTTPLSEQFDWLLDQKPDYLLTFPSNLLALIRLSKERHAKLGALREVITLGEALDPAVREICEKEWGLPVVDAYSSQEFGMLAVQCPAAPHYHVQSENVLVEIIDERGAALRAGPDRATRDHRPSQFCDAAHPLRDRGSRDSGRIMRMRPRASRYYPHSGPDTQHADASFGRTNLPALHRRRFRLRSSDSPVSSHPGKSGDARGPAHCRSQACAERRRKDSEVID